MKNKNNELILYKNKDLIEITTNKITAQQLKAFNYIALRARKQLQKDPKQMIFYFEYSELEEAINCSKTNNKQLYETLDRLRKTDVYLIKDARNWANFSLISEVKRIENQLKIQLASTMCDCLLEKNYTTLDLKIIRNFNSKYTILFYEMYEKYKDINFPILGISDFKKFCGIENKKTYKDFHNIKREILKPALQELAEKEKIHLDYKLTKKGKRYDTIQFFIKNNAEDLKLEAPKMTQEQAEKAMEKFISESQEYRKLMKLDI